MLKSLSWGCAILGSSLIASPALALDNVTSGTTWLAQAEHGGYYQAVADSTYEKHGLKVTIRQVGPQPANRNLLIAGKIDFNMGGTPGSFDAVVQGIPVVTVAAIFQKDPQALLAHPDQGLDKSADLAKLKTIFLGREGYTSFCTWMKTNYPGFPDEQLKPYQFNHGPFLADKKSAQQVYVTSEPFEIQKQAGFVSQVFLLADNGYDAYSTTIETQAVTVTGKPEVAQRIVNAPTIGWAHHLYGNNAAANALIKTDNPDMTDGQHAFSLAKMKELGLVVWRAAAMSGIGSMTDERYRSFYENMASAGVLPNNLDYKKSTHCSLQVRRWGSTSRRFEATRHIVRERMTLTALPEVPARRVLKIDGVSKRFANGTLALQSVSLQIGSGEFVSLLGPSGCGKSTLLRIMAGLGRPSEGDIDWPSSHVSSDGLPDANIGFVFQEPTLIPWKPVFDNVYLPLQLKGVSRRAAREDVEALLDTVGLKEFSGAYPRELSGGMRMRVSIARGLVTRPKLLLMDEPFAALDEITRQKLNDDILRLWDERSLTVVFVTHSVFEAAYLSSRVLTMGARPGRVLSDVTLPPPVGRQFDPEFRTSTAYGELCRDLSRRLSEVMSPTFGQSN